MPLKHDIAFTLNGVSTRATVPVDMSALTMMRDVLGLTGTKYGCGEGECGACTIIVDGVSVNSCLMFAVECEGRQVATIEGLANDSRADALRDAHRRSPWPASPVPGCAATGAAATDAIASTILR